MTRLANNDAVRRGLAPPGNLPPDPAVLAIRRGRIPVLGVGLFEAPLPDRPIPFAGRQAVFDITTQPNPAWDIETGMSETVGGAHGVIVSRQAIGAAELAGAGMDPWRVDRRTLRQAPKDTWDAGTANGEYD